MMVYDDRHRAASSRTIRAGGAGSPPAPGTGPSRSPGPSSRTDVAATGPNCDTITSFPAPSNGEAIQTGQPLPNPPVPIADHRLLLLITPTCRPVIGPRSRRRARVVVPAALGRRPDRLADA